jgi:uncharacterized protein
VAKYARLSSDEVTMNPSGLTHQSRFRALTRTLALGAVALAVALIATNLPVRGVSADLVISQVYGGGGNSGAPFKNDFVEIFNRGTSAVSLAGKSVQYASATGTGNFGGNAIAVLSGTLQPGQYYLVQLAGGTNGVALPTADATGTVNMSGTGGKVALVNSASGLACNGGSTPCSAAQLAAIIDLVGWDGANFYEGTAAPATTNTTADLRANGGCTETDNNSADFTAAAPTPRNSASAFHYCTGPTNPSGKGAADPAEVEAGMSSTLTVSVTPGAFPPSTAITVVADLTGIGGSSAQSFYDDGTNGDVTAGDNVFSYLATVSTGTKGGDKALPFTVSDAQTRSGTGSVVLTVTPAPISICAIQGPGATSPYAREMVATQGVVTALKYNSGYFIQMPDEVSGCELNASRGVFVYTGSALPALAVVGAYVQVTGVVSEYVPSADPYSPPMTEIGSARIKALPTAYAMPDPVTLTAADLPQNGTLEQLERYEGMRVFVQTLRAVSPTEGTVSEANATATSNGAFYGVIDGTSRPFREAGVEVGDPLPAGAPDNVPRFDFNPERLRVNSWGQIGSTAIDVTTGALVSNLVGVLDYSYRTWTILPDVSSPPVVSGGLVGAEPVPEPGAHEFTVASFNMERFYDTVNDGGVSDVKLTPEAFELRLSKASLAIRNVLLMPDILGVQEVENLTTLQALAARINTDAGAASPDYVAYLLEGNDIGGIDVGFLVRSDRVKNIAVVQEGKDATYNDPATGLPYINHDTGLPELLNDRPPLVLTCDVQGPTGTLPLTVIVNHLRSLSGIDDAADGARVRAKRLAQAQFLAGLIRDRMAADPFERIVSVGDYNAYEVNDGYVDVIGTITGTSAPKDQVVLWGPVTGSPVLTDATALADAADRYSYSYDGSAQLLDHIIVNDNARDRLTRLHFARSNADFPEILRSDPTRPERLSDHDMPVAYFTFPHAPKLKLKGHNPMMVECCSTFTDPGAVAIDDDFGDISSSIVVTGAVDSHTLGRYTLTYSVSNGYATSTATRTVKVVDTRPPVLTLNGPNPMTVELGSVFVDPGATAIDRCAGDLTGAITVWGRVHTSRVGVYRVVYLVSDGFNRAAMTRLVKVVDTTPPGMSAVMPTPSVLWPANHQLEDVRLRYTVHDSSGWTRCSIGVTSNEPVSGTGFSDRAPDWLIRSATWLELRAERADWGAGRIYTITVTCRDGSGNSAFKTTTVTVPKNMGPGKK